MSVLYRVGRDGIVQDAQRVDGADPAVAFRSAASTYLASLTREAEAIAEKCRRLTEALSTARIEAESVQGQIDALETLLRGSLAQKMAPALESATVTQSTAPARQYTTEQPTSRVDQLRAMLRSRGPLTLHEAMSVYATEYGVTLDSKRMSDSLRLARGITRLPDGRFALEAAS